ncbi:MAG: hypothetical protein HY913_00470 [Desulfomonile tiedjei]|nr:hypothetical protein [Desulfomonile tiedjei]
MTSRQIIWIHQSTFTYRLDAPEKILETIWCERRGWGYLRRRDLWIETDFSSEELETWGYEPLEPQSEGKAQSCPSCGMYICSIPGALVAKHFAECRGGGENWQRFEDILVEDQRRTRYEAKVLAEKLRLEAELADMEKRERFDKIKEEQSVRQLRKDRKARLRRETKEEWKSR